jgi:hypothetical protein
MTDWCRLRIRQGAKGSQYPPLRAFSLALLRFSWRPSVPLTHFHITAARNQYPPTSVARGRALTVGYLGGCRQTARCRIGALPSNTVLCRLPSRGVEPGNLPRGNLAMQKNPTREPFADIQAPVRTPEERLDSWKEIAAYLNRDVTTVQRWEKREGMPVHRHLHG